MGEDTPIQGEEAPAPEAFLEIAGIAFGLSDVILLGALGVGAVWYFFLRKDNSRNDVTANFSSYTIQ